MIAPMDLEKAAEATENTEWARFLRESVFLPMGESGKAIHTLFFCGWGDASPIPANPISSEFSVANCHFQDVCSNGSV